MRIRISRERERERERETNSEEREILCLDWIPLAAQGSASSRLNYRMGSLETLQLEPGALLQQNNQNSLFLSFSLSLFLSLSL